MFDQEMDFPSEFEEEIERLKSESREKRLPHSFDPAQLFRPHLKRRLPGHHRQQQLHSSSSTINNRRIHINWRDTDIYIRAPSDSELFDVSYSDGCVIHLVRGDRCAS